MIEIPKNGLIQRFPEVMRSDVDACCFLGLKKFDEMAAWKWLQENKWLFLVDEEPFSISPQLLNHSRVRFFNFETPLLLHKIAQEIAWGSVMLSMDVFAEDRWKELGDHLEECRHAAHLLLSEVADFGIQAFSNARKNWEKGSFRSWKGMQGRFNDIPAIVCGAGPSLKEARSILPQLSSHALILAAGTAGSILNDWGIAPHLVFAIDKEMSPEWIMQQSFPESPCILQSRLSPACNAYLHSEKIIAPESGPIPWESWWLEEERPSFGWTVGNFATQIAIWMGCNPIIWTGMDCCYPDNQKYAQPSANKASIEINHRMTQRDFFLSARFFEEIAQSNPNIEFINTSLQGFPFKPPIETRPFCSIPSILEKEFDLEGLLHHAIQMSPSICFDTSKEAAWMASVERCLNHCGNSDLSDEIVYEFYLKPLWQIWQPIFARATSGQDIEIHRMLFFQKVLQEMKL